MLPASGLSTALTAAGRRVAAGALAGDGGSVAIAGLDAAAFVSVAGLRDADVVSIVVALVVTASLPLYLYGAWIILDAEVVTWSVLTRHLRYVGSALVLTTVPMVTWMLPQLLEGITGLRAIHTVFGLQAYALLLFGLTGIVQLFRAKRAHSLYEAPDQDVALSELHENVDAWRFRLRVGVFGYLLCWIVTYLLGLLLLAVRLL